MVLAQERHYRGVRNRLQLERDNEGFSQVPLKSRGGVVKSENSWRWCADMFHVPDLPKAIRWRSVVPLVPGSCVLVAGEGQSSGVERAFAKEYVSQ